MCRYKEKGEALPLKVIELVPVSERLPALTKTYGAEKISGILSIAITKALNNFNLRVGMNAEQIIKEKQGTIIDVRTPNEFMGGSVVGSINIPLQEIQLRMDELKNLKQPLVLCCASGNRSGQATHFLSQQGIECCNGGSWLDVNYYQSQTI
jgi:rhodanese-related sulfurtransferase